MQLSLTTVTYNHHAEIAPCLRAVLAAAGQWQAEIIVVDNASTDDTIKIVREIRQANQNERFTIQLVPLPTNTGFTHATNIGLQRSRGAFLMLLNPDTRVTPTALSQLMDYLQANPEVGLVAPQLLNPDGSIQPSCRRFPRRSDVVWHLFGFNAICPKSKIFNHWKMGDFSHQYLAEVDQPQGAALMTTRQALEDVGLLDEQFPMFFSDVDWCRRFKERGWKIVYYSEARIIHQKGTSIQRKRVPMIWSSHQSFFRYFRKYRPGLVNRFLNWGVGGLLFFTAGIRIIVIYFRNLVKHKK